MKKMKKMIALMLALVMCLSMSGMSVFADEPAETKGSIIVKPSSTVTLADKTLKAYKILDATYSGTGTDQAVAYTIPAALLSFYDEYFGNGKTGDEKKTASQLAAEAGLTVDVYVTQQMKDWQDDAQEIKDFEYAALAAAKAANVSAIAGTPEGDNVKFADLDAGYYVIEDEGTATPISMLMLDTVTNAAVEITLKASDESDKQILTAEELVNKKANELGLGRAVNYVYTTKVPDTTGYDYYYFMVNDTLSTGLTFDPASVKVEIVDKDDNTKVTTLTKTTDYYLYADKTADAAVLGSKTFIVAFKDMVADITAKKYNAGDTINVYYSGIINSDAVVGVDPNNNKANVTYSNNPDKDGKGDFDTNHPGVPANDEDHPTGETPDKWTDSYTTKVKVVKIDGKTKEKLKDVEFTLTGTSKDVVVNGEEVYEIDPAGEYWMLKTGKYTTTAPTTTPTLRETTGSAGWVEMTADDTYKGTDIRVIGDKKYRPYVKETDSAKTRYVIVEPNDADYASLTIKYKKVTKNALDAEEYSVTRVGTTDTNGEVSFAQLGAGTFTLSETEVLAGYNGIKDIPFTIACTLPAESTVLAGTEKATWTVTSTAPGVTFVEGTGKDAGTFTITIENNKGTELPSTGGIGTTMFYVIGTILVLGAAVLLISKRRMNAR